MARENLNLSDQLAGRLADAAQRHDVTKTAYISEALNFLLALEEQGIATTAFEAPPKANHASILVLGNIGLQVTVVTPGELPAPPI